MTPAEEPPASAPSAPWAAPTAPAAPALVTESQLAAQPRRRRLWIPLTIIGGILVIVALVAAAVFAVSTLAARGFGTPSFSQPLETGAPQWPTPIKQLTCDGPCFTTEDIAATVMSDEDLDYFGLTKHDFPWGTYDPITADSAYRDAVASWKGHDGRPDECIFTLGASPSVIDVTSDKGVLDEIQYTGDHATDDLSTSIDQSVRVFPDTAAATAYLTTLQSQINACTELTVGTGANTYTAEISPAPALNLREDEASIGWVRTGDPGPRWRAYIYDVQRGNLVVRTRMLTDGGYYESEFRDFVEYYAFQLDDIVPAGAS
jgi:hypothetical protein